MGNITVQRPDLDRISAEGRVFAYHEAAATAEGGRVVRVFVSVIAPGEQIPPHSHPLGTETWVYILRGQVEHRYGAHLETSMKNTPGDLLHIEAGTPHQPVNLSDDEPVIALVACNYDQNDPANCRLHDPVRGAAVADDARRRPPQVDDLGSELAARLVEGWSAFSKSPRFREFADFAHFLDASDEFQTVHRPRHPHPAHEFAAREMGIPFMAELRRRALHLDGWFPGRFDASSEEAWPEPFVDGKGEAHQVVARVFHSAVLRADGTEVCRLSVAFPHLHDGFGFPFPPRVSVAPSI